MNIFKFGGASVKDAEGVKNLCVVLKRYPGSRIGVVVSAMGKSTNALEKLLEKYFTRQDWHAEFDAIGDFHLGVARELFPEHHPLIETVRKDLENLQEILEERPSENYDYEYDRIVSFGEILSTRIVSQYLNERGVLNAWWDAREVIRTDNNYREGRIDWERTAELVSDHIIKMEEASPKPRVFLTQGFIGHTPENNPTTLGREGSDFTAAVLAFVLDAESVTIWKDVPGVLNADPKFFNDTVKLKQISYREAIELAYFGASVIHPKTIKPLQNKEIPLYVKSFLHPDEEGTLIHSATYSDTLVPSYIFKRDQILISLSPRDFSFVNEENLSQIFGLFAARRVRINLMQNSAINFSVCVDDIPARIDPTIELLRNDFEVRYNRQCELVTVRHYDQQTLSRLLVGKTVLVEQRSRNTARLVLKD